MSTANRVSRRTFFRVAGTAGAAVVASGVLTARRGWGAALTQAERDRLTPDEIIQMMKNGNERFRRGQKTTQDYLAQQRASARGQYPAAVLLSCIDSRAPAETIMDLGIGDVFNTRVAGNVVKALWDATAEYFHSAKASVTATGELDVSAYGDVLKARSLVDVRGVGRTMDGTWYVQSTTNTLSRGSWKQSFSLEREGTIAQSPKVLKT